MNDEPKDQPPAWWLVDRRAAHAAERRARREERSERRAAKRAACHGDVAREPLTPERIADAALAVIDAEGVDGLTVRGLAETLGVGTMTLYWYVQNKDEVLDLVADRLLAGVVMPSSPDDWRSAARSLALAVRTALNRHVRAVPIIVSRASFGPNGLELLERSIALLRQAGFDAEDAADAYFALSNYVTGCSVFEASRVDMRRDLPADQEASTRATQYVSLLPPDRYPNLLAAAPRLFSGDRDARFTFGLDCLLDGLASRLASVPPPADPV